MAAAAAGLHHAHEARDENGEPLELVHRDVSPHNIFVTYGGDVKVMDFGVAKAAGRITTTETGGRKGKLAYMSPEQLLNDGLDRRTDVFALGIILWEMTLARRLFRGENDAQTISRILNGTFKKPTELEPGYPLELEAIVLKALARDPENRYSTAQELQIELEAFAARYSTVAGSLGLAGLMRDLFPDRIEQKRTLLRSAATTAPTPSSAGAVVAPRVIGREADTGSGVHPPGTPGTPAETPEFSQISPSQHSRELRGFEERARTSKAPLVVGGLILTALLVLIGLSIKSQYDVVAPPPDNRPIVAAVVDAGEASSARDAGSALIAVVITDSGNDSGTATTTDANVHEDSGRRGATHEPLARAIPVHRADAGRRPPSTAGNTEPPDEGQQERRVAPPSGATTPILVLSTPWSRVRVNGTAVGNSPYRGMVPVGPVVVELTPEGGASQTIRRTAREGERVNINCNLAESCS